MMSARPSLAVRDLGDAVGTRGVGCGSQGRLTAELTPALAIRASSVATMTRCAPDRRARS